MSLTLEPGRTGAEGPVIDADAHAVEDYDGFLELLEPSLRAFAPRFELGARGSARLVAIEGRDFQPAFAFEATQSIQAKQQLVGEAATNAAARVAVLDAEGIDCAVIFPSLGLYFGLYRDAQIAEAMCRAENRWLGQWCGRARKRLAPAAVLPQQDAKLASAELRRAVEEDGAVAGVVRPNPCAGKRVARDEFDVLWRTAVDLDVPIVFHEGWVGGGFPTLGSDRAGSYAAAHAMSHPFEAMASLLEIIQGGVLIRYPDLRLAFFEAGCGWAPWWFSRIAEHAALRPEEFRHVMPSPDRIWLSLDPSEPAEEGLASSAWQQSVCFASDFPHADGMFPGAVRSLRTKLLPSAVERQILGGNALRLFGPRLIARMGDADRPPSASNRGVRDFLEARGAGTAPHSGRALIQHLEATSDLLRSWGAREALCLAGILHSAYGSDALELAIVNEVERPVVSRLVGEEAENLAWLFGRCRQQALVDTADGAPLVIDRVLGIEIVVTAQHLQDLCELCVANWLEQRPRLDVASQDNLLAASSKLAPWLTEAARSALALARETESDDRALRRWVSNSHRVVTLTLGGGRTRDPSFEPAAVLAHAAALDAMRAIGSELRCRRWDNVGNEHPASRLALREPVAAHELVQWLGVDSIEALTAVGALARGDGDAATLAVGMVLMGDEVVVVPGDGRRQDGVYFGIEPILLEMVRRAVAPNAEQVLELGAGAGLASVLAARRANSTATDVLSRATDYVELTRALNPHLDNRLRALTADGANGLPAASFDLVLTNPPLVPRLEGMAQATYSLGGPTGAELPIRLLHEALSLLRPGGCAVMLSLDSLLHDGRRPLSEALAALKAEWTWTKLISPWRFMMPNSVPRLLATHRDKIAAAHHVGVLVIRPDEGGGAAARQRLHRATAALCGSGWSLPSQPLLC